MFDIFARCLAGFWFFTYSLPHSPFLLSLHNSFGRERHLLFYSLSLDAARLHGRCFVCCVVWYTTFPTHSQNRVACDYHPQCSSTFRFPSHGCGYSTLYTVRTRARVSVTGALSNTVLRFLSKRRYSAVGCYSRQSEHQDARVSVPVHSYSTQTYTLHTTPAYSLSHTVLKYVSFSPSTQSILRVLSTPYERVCSLPTVSCRYQSQCVCQSRAHYSALVESTTGDFAMARLRALSTHSGFLI